MPPLSQLRARPDFYVLKWRAKAHRETQKSRAAAIKLHSRYGKEVRRIAKSDLTVVQKSRAFVMLGEDFHDEFERELKERVSDVMQSSAREGQKIINLMLPKGVSPSGNVVIPEYWDREFKGATPETRLALARLKTRRKMARIASVPFKGAPVLSTLADVEDAEEVWTGVQGYISTLAANEPWVGALASLAQNFETNVDVIDHYEFLATLDELTCDECGALDGTILPAGEFESDLAIDEAVDVHPNCRCVAVPVTKTWEELGFAGIEEPEGTRIARPYYPVDSEGGRDWGKSSPGEDSVQGYVPADTRYKDWQAKKQGEQ